MHQRPDSPDGLPAAGDPPSSPGRDAVIAEALRLVEERGPLDDDAAMRTAFAADGSLSGRIAARARVLGRRLGLDDEFDRLRHWAPWIGAGLGLSIMMAGLTMAGGVTGAGDRRINVMAALLSLLGLHALTLAAWLVGLLLPPRAAGPRGFSLGGLWMALTARVAGGRQGQAPLLARAAMRLLVRARLLPWAAGIVSHGLWTLSFVAALAAMLSALAFRRYTLDWETTLLDPGFFLHAVELLGRAPSWLGFPTPDAVAVLSPATASAPGTGAAFDAAAQRSWAWWLIGCIVVYGLLPRALLLALCLGMWRSRRQSLAPDLSLPYYRRLAARFDALAPTHIVDADPGLPPAMTPTRAGPIDGDATVVAAFELAPGQPWPPAGPLPSPADGDPAALTFLDAADGSARSRRELLDAVARRRPGRLVLAVRAASSPDRGTERLLRELLAHVGACHLWLMADGLDTAGDGRARWRQWLLDTGLDRIAASDTLADALPAPASGAIA